MFPPMDRGPQITMAEQPEPEKRKRHLFREEDAPNLGRNVCERIPHAADDEILERGRPLQEGALFCSRDEVPVMNKCDGQFDHFGLSVRAVAEQHGTLTNEWQCLKDTQDRVDGSRLP